MNFKRSAALSAAVLIMFLTNIHVLAEDVTTPGSESATVSVQTTLPQSESSSETTSEETVSRTVTSAPQTPEPTQPITTTAAPVTTTSSATTTAPLEDDTPTTEAAVVSLDISSVKKGNFTVKLNITSEAAIANAEIWLEYDPKVIKFVSASPNYDIGGEFPVETKTDKVMLGYSNNYGTYFDGTFTAATFKIVDNTVASTVIYVNAETLTNVNGRNIANSVSNGVVTNNEYKPKETEPEKTTEYKPITVGKSKSPVTLESLGIKNAKDCMIENSDILKYANGSLELLNAGSSRLVVTYKNGKKEYFLITVEDDVITQTQTSAVDENTQGKNDRQNSKLWIWGTALSKLWICVTALLIAVAALAFVLIIYFTVIRGKKSKAPSEKPTDENLSDNDSGQSENDDI